MAFMKQITGKRSSSAKKNESINNNMNSKKETKLLPKTEEEKRGEVIIHQPPWKVPAINDRFPNLIGHTLDNSEFNLYDYKGSSWALMFTHPTDFNAVGTSELEELLKLKSEFDANKIKIVGFSTNIYSDAHRKWLDDVEAMVNGYDSNNNTTNTTNNEAKKVKADFPIYTDPTLEMAVELGIVDSDTIDEDGLPVTSRTLYVLTPDNKIALVTTYPTTVGRNWKEALRSIIALQLVERSRESIIIPSHWERGEKVLIETKLTDSECEITFGPGNWERVFLPSEVCQEVGSFVEGIGGVRIKEDRKNLLSSNNSITTLPRHYMRYTMKPVSDYDVSS
mmetsp:Transcript_14744/g.21056  ORF Transcript_14744/g.21056 Transcript_14744/m.21056 type:complete len:337 (+) Transcript_14744:185-1195(+)|eukprot:CAMPEP_0172434610 /NCGR_PEP_ID=MMETSP1064-20121228/70724_1 /TAXON_ID=202472 /ORGANISM="Aulacoseira subarctica , Strain CCAP 1002/5" /LENGTH=336 /DNA_ID=CAMNT_0013182843 /DNA_START=131 /DNA_END=1141 /DNA_ORIENTATION=-